MLRKVLRLEAVSKALAGVGRRYRPEKARICTQCVKASHTMRKRLAALDVGFDRFDRIEDEKYAWIMMVVKDLNVAQEQLWEVSVMDKLLVSVPCKAIDNPSLGLKEKEPLHVVQEIQHDEPAALRDEALLSLQAAEDWAALVEQQIHCVAHSHDDASTFRDDVYLFPYKRAPKELMLCRRVQSWRPFGANCLQLVMTTRSAALQKCFSILNSTKESCLPSVKRESSSRHHTSSSLRA